VNQGRLYIATFTTVSTINKMPATQDKPRKAWIQPEDLPDLDTDSDSETSEESFWDYKGSDGSSQTEYSDLEDLADEESEEEEEEETDESKKKKDTQTQETSQMMNQKFPRWATSTRRWLTKSGPKPSNTQNTLNHTVNFPVTH
jgi:hypothetical protein